jgi:hypothetical protein
MRLLVLAGSRSEAELWVNRKAVDPATVVHIDTLRGIDCMGLRPDDQLVFTGQWWRRRDLRQLGWALWRMLAKTSAEDRPPQVVAQLQPLIDDWRANGS